MIFDLCIAETYPNSSPPEKNLSTLKNRIMTNMRINMNIALNIIFV